MFIFTIYHKPHKNVNIGGEHKMNYKKTIVFELIDKLGKEIESDTFNLTRNKIEKLLLKVSELRSIIEAEYD